MIAIFSFMLIRSLFYQIYVKYCLQLKPEYVEERQLAIVWYHYGKLFCQQLLKTQIMFSDKSDSRNFKTKQTKAKVEPNYAKTQFSRIARLVFLGSFF